MQQKLTWLLDSEDSHHTHCQWGEYLSCGGARSLGRLRIRIRRLGHVGSAGRLSMQLITTITSVAKLIAIGIVRTLSSTSVTTASSSKVSMRN